MWSVSLVGGGMKGLIFSLEDPEVENCYLFGIALVGLLALF